MKKGNWKIYYPELVSLKNMVCISLDFSKSLSLCVALSLSHIYFKAKLNSVVNITF